MTIEDIDYLYEKGTKENKVIFVDSLTRDMIAYPSPSEYVVEFTEPFTNVYGLEILDAAIPRTQYNIDLNNNKVVFAMGPRADQEILETSTTAYVPALDYGSSELAVKLSDIIATNGCSMNVVSIGTSVMTFASSMPFAFNMDESSISECLGFEYIAPSNDYKSTHVSSSSSTPNYRILKPPSHPYSKIYGSVSAQVANSDGIMNMADSYLVSPYANVAQQASLPISIPLTASAWAMQSIRLTSDSLTPPTYISITSLSIQLVLRNVLYTSQPILSWTLYATKPTPITVPMYSGQLAFDAINMTALSTAFSDVYLFPNVDYWVVFKDIANITPSTSACYGIPTNTPTPTPTPTPVQLELQTPATIASTTINSGLTWIDIGSSRALSMTITSVPITFVPANSLPSINETFGTYYSTPVLINSIPLTTNSWLAEPLYIDKTNYTHITLQALEFQVAAKGGVDPTTSSLNWSIYPSEVNSNSPGTHILYGGPLTLTTNDNSTVARASITTTIVLKTNVLYWIIISEKQIVSQSRCMTVQYNTTSNLRTLDYIGVCSSWNGYNWSELSVATLSSPRFACAKITWALTSQLLLSSLPSFPASQSQLKIIAKTYPIAPDARLVGSNIKPLTSNHWIAQYIIMPATPICITLRVITVQLTQIGLIAPPPSTLTWSVYLSSSAGTYPTRRLFSGSLLVDPDTLVANSIDLSLNEDSLVVLRNDETERYWLVIEDTGTNTDETQCMAVTYIPGGLPDTSSNYLGLGSDNGGYTWQKACNNYCVNITYTHKTFTLTPPGFLSLVGDRFIILRCPEIERNIFGSMAFGSNSPGIALFKMGCVGYSDSRFDFSTVEYKEFHPIGKLPRLSFRFERLDGELYNFKAVNHHLMIVVKHYVARKTRTMDKSTLNPNYNPNFLAYKRYMEEHETSSVEDDEQHVDSRTFRDVYLQKERALRDQFQNDDEDEEDDEDDAGSDDNMENSVRYVGNVYRKAYRDTGPYQDSSSDEDA